MRSPFCVSLFGLKDAFCCKKGIGEDPETDGHRRKRGHNHKSGASLFEVRNTKSVLSWPPPNQEAHLHKSGTSRAIPCQFDYGRSNVGGSC